MKKLTCILALLLVTSCETMQPVDMSFEVNALGGLIKVRPAFTIGDGHVGPTSLEIETAETSTEVIAADENP